MQVKETDHWTFYLQRLRGAFILKSLGAAALCLLVGAADSGTEKQKDWLWQRHARTRGSAGWCAVRVSRTERIHQSTRPEPRTLPHAPARSRSLQWSGLDAWPRFRSEVSRCGCRCVRKGPCSVRNWLWFCWLMDPSGCWWRSCCCCCHVVVAAADDDDEGLEQTWTGSSSQTHDWMWFFWHMTSVLCPGCSLPSSCFNIQAQWCRGMREDDVHFVYVY